MANPKTPIIIKKIKKGHAAHHGGSWKVAYADFVTAMMAFFLLLWLLAMVSPEKKAALSDHFRDYNIFESTGVSIMDQPSTQMVSVSQNKKEGSTEDRTVPRGAGSGGPSAEELVKKLKGAVDERLKALKDQIIVDTVEGGVSVQIVDNEGGIMFLSGQPEPTAKAKEIIKIVAESIKDVPNRISVEGHTDAAPIKAGGITNWELSTNRASAARRELESNGIETGRIARVVGYADQELYIKHNPLDPRNRRISIILILPKN
ncbi:MAG: flagellar motor protein MotB [Smithellaceae bacterium]|nr:flagellar motor protein MotB [Smithellaceae bacterium]